MSIDKNKFISDLRQEFLDSTENKRSDNTEIFVRGSGDYRNEYVHHLEDLLFDEEERKEDMRREHNR